MDILFCAGGNKQLMGIAYEAGMGLGIRSDRPSHGFPIVFVDSNYRHPPAFEEHLRAMDQAQPRYAIVRDLSERETCADNIERAVREARILAHYCEVPLLVPKRPGQIELLPADLASGYSVPTRHGAAQYPL